MKKRAHIVALHGAGMNAGAFAGLVPHLLDHELAALDFPGHRDHHALLPSISDMAKFVRKKIAGNAPKSNILLGHSMGALVAMEAASDPSVAGVVLLGAAAQMPVNAELLQTAQEQPAKAQELVAKWSVFKDHPQNAAVRTVISVLMREALAGAIYNDLKACNEYTGAPKTGKPTLVISGAADKMASPEQGKALAAQLDCYYAVIPSCGHMMMLENPHETASEIRKFISLLPH